MIINKTEVYAPQPKVVVEAEICNVLLENMLGMKKILFQHCCGVLCGFIINYDPCRPPDSVQYISYNIAILLLGYKIALQ